MTTTRLFRSNRTQAVRLPKDVAFPDGVTEVEVLVVGDARIVVPQGRRWDYFFGHGLEVTDDFMTEREQPPVQERTTV
ncbi:MAG: type II toxin-antitoxin system VapB family antitoxin [Nocardioides sp.]|uniref:type II toxin-antitoxin system VapB family antitoxin n=1 Tax=Nocardioides sp. TaxID=35761 RepID=UPI0039E32FF4